MKIYFEQYTNIEPRIKIDSITGDDLELEICDKLFRGYNAFLPKDRPTYTPQAFKLKLKEFKSQRYFARISEQMERGEWNANIIMEV